MISIVRMNYAKGINEVSAVYKGQEQKHYIRFKVDESNLLIALEDCKNKDNVVAFDYSGSLDFLSSNKDKINNLLNGKKIIYYLIFNSLKDLIKFNFDNLPNLDFLHYTVKLVFESYPGIKTLRIISGVSKSYPKLSFCSPYLCSIPDIQLGCITDIANEKSKGKFISKYCHCVIPTIDAEDMEGLIVR